MKKQKWILPVGILVLCIGIFLPATSGLFEGHSSVVMHSVVDTKEYTNRAEIEKAEEKTAFETGADLFISVDFIESPKGTEYEVRWVSGDTVVETVKKKMVEDRRGVLTFLLPADKVLPGTYEVQIRTRGKVIESTTFTVQ